MLRVIVLNEIIETKGLEQYLALVKYFVNVRYLLSQFLLRLYSLMPRL